MSRELQAIAVLLLILGLAYVGYGQLFGEAAGERLVVTAVEGAVSRVDGFGAATPAAPGQALKPRDRIVASEGGRAVLALGAESRVTLEERSSMRVVTADQSGVKLELEGGRVQATIRPGSGQVGISAEGASVVTGDADFTVIRAEDGTLGVVTERGEVGLQGLGETTRLGAGERLVAAPGGSALVAPASEELLLHVAWPASTRTQDEVAQVRGRTEPNARVRVGREGDWTEVKADANGDFVATAKLAEGANDLRVEAFSVLGASAVVAHTVERDTKPPSFNATVRP